MSKLRAPCFSEGDDRSQFIIIMIVNTPTSAKVTKSNRMHRVRWKTFERCVELRLEQRKFQNTLNSETRSRSLRFSFMFTIVFLNHQTRSQRNFWKKWKSVQLENWNILEIGVNRFQATWLIHTHSDNSIRHWSKWETITWNNNNLDSHEGVWKYRLD